MQPTPLILSALFLTLASLASAVPVRQIPGLTAVTYHERTGGSAPVAQMFLIDDPRMTTRRADPLSINNNDFAGVPDKEFYDVFYSDVDGTPNADGEFLTIEGVYSSTAPAGGALNLAEITLNFSGGATEYGLYVASFLALGDNAVPTTVFNCIDGDLQTHTTMGNTVGQNQRMRITLGFQSSSGEPVGANLAISKKASFKAVSVSSNFTYTITVVNLWNVTNTNVIVTDFLPAKVDLLAFTSSTGTCTNIDGIVTCELGDLPPRAMATITLDVAPARIGIVTNTVSAVADQSEAVATDNESIFVTELAQTLPPDLTAAIDVDFADCAAGKKGVDCPLIAQLLLLNNGIIYGDATVELLKSCATNTVPPKCKIKGILTLNELDLTGLADHTVAFYLSTDTAFDAADSLLAIVPLNKAIKAFFKGKPVKVSFKLPKGVDLTDRHILAVVDAPGKTGLNAVDESNETNNTAASPAIPAIP
ncbi:MAG: hypothetical protein PCFJNLEI_03191 [Verrucomicrobiae bacterium]|nr:hypothetical protein [Verrucomicrobiae bacterium]